MNTVEDYSLTAISKILGRSKGGLHKLREKGQIPQLPNGRYDLKAVQKALRENIDPARGKAAQQAIGDLGERPVGERVNTPANSSASAPISTPDDAAGAVHLVRRILEEEGAKAGAVLDFNAVRTAEMIIKVHRQSIELDEQAGRLCCTDTVEKVAFEIAREQRDALLNWPNQVGAMIADQLGTDTVKTIVVLEKFMREFLLDQADPERTRAKVRRKIRPPSDADKQTENPAAS